MSDDAPDAGPPAVDWVLRPRGGWPRLLAAASVFLSLVLSLFPLYSTDFGQTEAHAHRSTAPASGPVNAPVRAVVHGYQDVEVYEVEFIDEHGRFRCVGSTSADQLLKLNLLSLTA